MAVTDFFDRGWRANPDGVAFVAGDRSYTYQEIGELSCRVAHALLERTTGREVKGAVLAGNDPVAWACVLGLWRAGLAWVPVNPASPPEEIQRLLKGFDCEVLFCHERFLPTVEKLRTDLGHLHTVVSLGSDPDAASAARAVPFEQFLRDMPHDRPRHIPSPESVAGIMPTGGTTGAPKGVMNTHRGLTVSAVQQMLAASYSADETVVNLVAAPMTHTAGTLTLPVTARGGTVVVMSRPDPVELLDLIEKHRVTELFLPPTVIYRLLEIPGVEQRDFSSLKYLMYGSAPMSTEKLRRAIEVFGPVMFQGYGQTEAPAAIAFMRPEEHFTDGRIADDSRLSAAGRPAPLVRVEVLDEDGTILPVGGTGEICVRGDLVMKGYYKAPDKTAETLVDGWLHTGDVGYLDTDGFLHITDRKKDMIISGGFNVYPSEVEQVIWRHPAVQDCAVIGVPHEDWGEAVTAVVELNPGAELTEDELIAYCRPQLGGIKNPKKVVFTDSLPRSANGKVLKKDVREPFWRGRERLV
ncbi:acyl-CoA synthetase [Streptomyces spongiae]|uniref:Long-chain fatty acid--CoA ligase n=1 Tax=Streptomyces spongiae TaxID=565072 RepID=A0A5N8X926_9ACTN|nr:long-chain fatty acid--CoA ligase [Streptomyces spongiae]MPY55943.1 long-chain fatty acid--CoA ligase [Streptomyces spongiae]